MVSVTLWLKTDKFVLSTDFVCGNAKRLIKRLLFYLSVRVLILCQIRLEYFLFSYRCHDILSYVVL